METVFNIFQNCEENKTLVYVSISSLTFYMYVFGESISGRSLCPCLWLQMLLSFLMRELFPDEHSLNLSAALLQRGTSCTH